MKNIITNKIKVEPEMLLWRKQGKLYEPCLQCGRRNLLVKSVLWPRVNRKKSEESNRCILSLIDSLFSSCFMSQILRILKRTVLFHHVPCIFLVSPNSILSRISEKVHFDLLVPCVIQETTPLNST